jgi:hypothetical protein
MIDHAEIIAVEHRGRQFFKPPGIDYPNPFHEFLIGLPRVSNRPGCSLRAFE